MTQHTDAERAEFERMAIAENLAYRDSQHGVVFWDNTPRFAAMKAWQAARHAPAAPVQHIPGWQFVPVEPTLDMLDQGHHQIDFDRCDQRTDVLVDSSHTGELGVGTTIEQDMRDCWAAMLAAAPKAEPVPAGEYPPLPGDPALGLVQYTAMDVRKAIDADRAMRMQIGQRVLAEVQRRHAT